jgi:cell division protein FtsI/penicillin-binding protein 2
MPAFALAAVVLVANVSDGRIMTAQGEESVNRRVAPGSTIKPFVLLALAAEGIATPVLPCERKVRLQGRNLDCSHPVTAAPLDAAAALAYSCNSYFARAARLVEPARLAARLRDAGFEVRDAGSNEEVALQGIGEAAVWTTPRALLDSYRRLAAGPPVAVVREGLEGAVEFGSAQWAAAPGVRVAGKTGTTPNAARTRTHAWFAGFAPSDRPEVVVVVFVEDGRGGSNAAPVAGEVFREWWAKRGVR